jgi:hypothetical protein
MRIRLFPISVTLASTCLLIAGIATAEGGPIKVAREISFAETSGVRAAVRNECKLETKVTRFLDEYSEEVELVDDPSGSKDRLELTITNVNAGGGGAWSGPKSMTVQGQLFQNGKPGPTFTASRYSGGGMFAAYKGTCSIVGRCAKAIGKDIAKWLENPTNDAALGDE